MFATAPEGSKLRPSEYGYRAVAVPGLVAGRCQILKEYGKLDLPKVLEPAIHLADEGFPVDTAYVEATKDVLPVYETNPDLKESCGYVWRTHLREGDVRKPGDTLKQPELAKLMRRIAKRGAEFFYEGEFADAFAAQMKENGGIIGRRDLAEYKPKYREPLLTSYHEYKLILMPPPSSGGVAIAETLNILEALDFVLLVKSEPIKALRYHIEAMRTAFSDRAQFLGDTDFVEVPIDYLTSKSTSSLYAKQIAQRARGVPAAHGAPGQNAPTPPPDDGGTSHFCIADKFGNVVVSTETINTNFGSLAAIDEWGLILNNEMDDFTAKPGEPNTFGLVQSEHNAVAPGKRPLSSMSPTIVLKDDKPFLLVGGAGGPRIISGVLNVIIGVIDYRRPLPDALISPRPHHQWQPDEVAFDQPISEEVKFEGRPLKTVADELVDLGFNVSEKTRGSTLQAIIRTDEGWLGVSEPRGGGKPAGY
jgi:gamma-glutamyltranspeptidase/glutathione hydrolase